MAKRGFDLLFAALGLLLLSPVLLVSAAAIRLSDGGPALYRGVRVGRRGRLFRILKFRTMTLDAEKVGGSSTADDDPRITRAGGFLRKFKIDELPQLINVLVGDMSFVGPRPQVPADVAKYTDEERLILSVRPGITDFASIRFHDEGRILQGHADPDRAYEELIRPEKLRLCLQYVRSHSFATDLKILWLTLKTLVVSRVRPPCDH